MLMPGKSILLLFIFVTLERRRRSLRPDHWPRFRGPGSSVVSDRGSRASGYTREARRGMLALEDGGSRTWLVTSDRLGQTGFF
jgi:hypothetical protein